MCTRSISAWVVLSLLPTSVWAQRSLVTTVLDSAAPVRLHLQRDGVITGVLLAPLGPESSMIVFAPPVHRDCGLPRAVCRMALPVSDVRAVDVPHGSRAAQGAALGSLFGGVLGLALGAAASGHEPVCAGVGPCGGGPSDAAIISFTTVIGLALGAGIGSLMGLGSPHWGPAP